MSLWIDTKYIGLLSSKLDKFSRRQEGLYNFRCPFCGDSKKSKWKARGYVYVVQNKMNYKCHNCQHSTSLSGLIEHLDQNMHKAYKLEKFKDGFSNTVVKTDKTFDYKPKFKTKDIVDDICVKLSKLEDDHIAIKFCKKRSIPEEKYRELYYINDTQKLEALSDKYKNRVFGNDKRLVIPFRNVDNELIGVTCRALEKNPLRYLTVKVNDQPLVYNLDKVDKNKIVYVTEGPIDSMFLPNSIAVGGSDLKRVLNSDYNFVFVFDNEPRNKELLKVMDSMLDYKMVVWPKNNYEKDVNDMILNDREIMNIIDKNTFSGLRLKMALSAWRK